MFHSHKSPPCHEPRRPIFDLPAGFVAKPLSAFLEDATSEYPERPLLRHGEQSFTFAEVNELAENVASGLLAQGVTKGDRIALCMPNHPVYIVTVFACWKIGAIGVGLNPLYAAPTLWKLLTDCAPKLLVTIDEPDLCSKLATAALDTGAKLVTAGTDWHLVSAATEKGAKPNALNYRSLILPGIARAAPELDVINDIAMLQYTGGTTGGPKAAMLTHANIYTNVFQFGRWLHQIEPGRERTIAAAPFAHITGLCGVLLLATAYAAEIIIMDRFTIDGFVETMQHKPASYLIVIPTMLVGLHNSPAAMALDWSGVKVILSGGAPTPVEIQSAFREATGVCVQPAYGLTETSPGAVVSLAERAPDDQSTGLPLPSTLISIRSATDPEVEVALGERGEICIAGPQVMKGYWNRPEATQAAMIGDYFRTGDIGFIDKDGRVTLSDRLKDIIIASGYNVYPAAVEEAVYRHPLVAEACVFGMDDPYRGETVAVLLACKDHTTFDHSEFKAFLSQHLSPIEMPKKLFVTAELPKTETGKLSRSLIREAIHRRDFSVVELEL
jgi:long-chain acyl-CoA synthetase